MSLEDDARWSRQHFDRMALGGTWAVPRSGLMFTKKDDSTLELMATMPYLNELQAAAAEGKAVPKSKEALIAYQQADFDLIRARFEAAGITVTGREKIT